MSSTQVSLIPARRRDKLFAEIKRVVAEAEAIDRSLEPLGEAMAQDQALEEIVDIVGAELARARRVSRRSKVAA